MAVTIAPGVHWLPHWFEQADRRMHLSTYLIECSQGNVLIDTGANIHEAGIVSDVTEVVGEAGIDTIILTHSTLEHTANIDAFETRWSDVETIASTTAPDVMGTPTASAWRLGQTTDIRGDEFSFLEPLLTDNVFTVWVYHAPSGVLFTSEAFGRYHTEGYSETSPLRIDDDPGAFANVFKYCTDRLEFLKFVETGEIASRVDEMFEEVDVDLIAPAHGNPLAVDDVDEYFELLDDVSTALAYSDPRLAQVEHDRSTESPEG